MIWPERKEIKHATTTSKLINEIQIEGRPVKDVAREMTDRSDEELDRRRDPASLTEGGIKN